LTAKKLSFKIEKEVGKMSTRVEVTVKFGDKEITLLGPEDFVQREVERLAHLAIGEQGSPALGQAATLSGTAVTKAANLIERDFVSQKQPSGHSEIVAVLAYVLTNNGQSEFTEEDVRRAYLRAAVRPPKVVSQALRDAKNLNDYIERGSKPGTYRLSPHGERTVLFDLPRHRDEESSKRR
jgi:hypothetical protein